MGFALGRLAVALAKGRAGYEKNRYGREQQEFENERKLSQEQLNEAYRRDALETNAQMRRSQLEAADQYRQQARQDALDRETRARQARTEDMTRMEQFQRDMQEDRQSNAAALAKLAATLRNQGTTPGATLSPKQMQMIGALQSRLGQHPILKNAQTLTEGVGKMRTAVQDPSPAGDLQLVFSYMKILDPTSAVRETEFANAQNAAAVPDRVRNTWNKILRGQRLTPEQRADFLNQGVSMVKSQRSLSAPVLEQYRRLATKGGLDPEDVVLDPFGTMDIDEQLDPKAQQRAEYDEAAAALKKRGQDPARVLGPRP